MPNKSSYRSIFNLSHSNEYMLAYQLKMMIQRNVRVHLDIEFFPYTIHFSMNVDSSKFVVKKIMAVWWFWQLVYVYELCQHDSSLGNKRLYPKVKSDVNTRYLTTVRGNKKETRSKVSTIYFRIYCANVIS